MKNVHAAILLLSTALCGCHFFGPRDMTGLKNITDITQLNNLPGVWKATNNTYNLMKRLEYPTDSIKIILHNDSTFEAFNIPDCVSDTWGNPVKHQLLPATGHWRPEKIGQEWMINMVFKQGRLYKTGVTTWYEIYIEGNNLLLGTYAGDPDEAKALDFTKPK